MTQFKTNYKFLWSMVLFAYASSTFLAAAILYYNHLANIQHLPRPQLSIGALLVSGPLALLALWLMNRTGKRYGVSKYPVLLESPVAQLVPLSEVTWRQVSGAGDFYRGEQTGLVLMFKYRGREVWIWKNYMGWHGRVFAKQDQWAFNPLDTNDFLYLNDDLDAGMDYLCPPSIPSKRYGKPVAKPA